MHQFIAIFSFCLIWGFSFSLFCSIFSDFMKFGGFILASVCAWYLGTILAYLIPQDPLPSTFDQLLPDKPKIFSKWSHFQHMFKMHSVFIFVSAKKWLCSFMLPQIWMAGIWIHVGSLSPFVSEIFEHRLPHMQFIKASRCIDIALPTFATLHCLHLLKGKMQQEMEDEGRKYIFANVAA